MIAVVARYCLQLGMNLIELLIVVTVVAVLAAVAYPSYQNHITQTRYAEAKVMLLQIMQQQRRYFTDNNTYTVDLIGELGNPDAGDDRVASENGLYLITATACGEGIAQCVLLSASPAFGDKSATKLTYNSQNIKTPAKVWKQSGKR